MILPGKENETLYEQALRLKDNLEISQIEDNS